jgi:predicted nucleic acid-binding protein
VRCCASGGIGSLLSEAQLSASIDRLLRLPVSRVQLRELFMSAWAHRHNVTFADAVYVALAERVNGSLLTGDQKLAASPTLTVPVLHLSPT